MNLLLIMATILSFLTEDNLAKENIYIFEAMPAKCHTKLYLASQL